VSYDPRIESIKAYKRMIQYFKREIAKLEKEIFTEICCFKEANKGRIYIHNHNKPKITK